MKLLSILIPTIPERRPRLKMLLGDMSYQLTKSDLWNEVEILIDEDKKMFEGGKHTGKKRQDLIEKAIGKYVQHVDDDDHLVDDYFETIIPALRKGPDVVTFCGWMTTDGAQHMDWEIRCGHPYDRHDNMYRRPPNHLVPILKEHALKIGYNINMSAGEDYDYCMRLNASNLLKNEIHIPKRMYHYDHSVFNKTHP